MKWPTDAEIGGAGSRRRSTDANQAQKRDPSIKGTITQTLEFTALLEVFSHVDEAKGRNLTVDDMKGQQIDGNLP